MRRLQVLVHAPQWQEMRVAAATTGGIAHRALELPGESNSEVLQTPMLRELKVRRLQVLVHAPQWQEMQVAAATAVSTVSIRVLPQLLLQQQHRHLNDSVQHWWTDLVP